MNRLDDLIHRDIDGDLNETEETELERLLEDTSNLNRYLQRMELEVSLRGLNEFFDVSRVTMVRITQKPKRSWMRRPLNVFAAAAAIMLILVSSFVLYKGSPQAASLVSLTGDVRIFRHETLVRTEQNQSLHEGDRIRTAAGGQAILQYADRTRLTLEGQSELTVHAKWPVDAGTAKYAFLTSGRLSADVSPQSPQRAMRIATGHAVITVIGTLFHVQSDTDSTRVDVEKGKVVINRPDHGNGLEVVAGQVSITESGTSPMILPHRITDGLIAFYPFDEGAGLTVHDRSGFGAPLDLRLHRGSTMTWDAKAGVTLPPESVLASEPAAKLVHACRQTREITIEAWLEPTVAKQLGPARIVTMSRASSAVNFMLAHGGYGLDRAQATFVGRLTTSTSKPSGFPRLETPPSSVDLKTMHVVLTRDAGGKRIFYLDGKPVATDQVRGDFGNWKHNLRLTLGNEFMDEDRFWQGRFKLVAIYNTALEPDAVDQNYRAGTRSAR
ncbi:MAG: LamG-like jellyroll fold domain-containing protein [Verrucomicrobiota bacterium]